MAVRRKSADGDTIEVVVVRAGGRPQRVQLEEGASLSDAISEAGYTVKSGDSVSVDGDRVEKDELDSYEVEDADKVVITPNFQGGR